MAALASPAAMAELGGAETTVAIDATALKADVKDSNRSEYRVHEMQLPSGTVVREFAAQNGRIFAVAWRGRVIPNLQQLLGGYFQTFTAEAGTSKAGHHQLSIKKDDFVMQSSGHMRAFSGRAYLPQFVPAGLSLDELH